jgi:hypothetical protein
MSAISRALLKLQEVPSGGIVALSVGGFRSTRIFASLSGCTVVEHINLVEYITQRLSLLLLHIFCQRCTSICPVSASIASCSARPWQLVRRKSKIPLHSLSIQEHFRPLSLSVHHQPVHRALGLERWIPHHLMQSRRSPPAARHRQQ